MFRAKPIAEIHDTTGAGDVFLAEYVAARLHEGASVPDASDRAAALAAQHVAGTLIAPGALALTASA